MLKADLIINSVGHLTLSRSANGLRLFRTRLEPRRSRDNPVTLLAGRDTRNEGTACSHGEETHPVEGTNIPQKKGAFDKFKYTLTKKKSWFESVYTLILCASFHLRRLHTPIKVLF